MAHATGSAWSEFGHVRFVIGHSPLAIGRNLYRAAWLGRNGHVRFAIGHSPLAIGHALGATRGMCGFPGNRRGSAHFRYFAAQTQQMCAPWSASIARPPDSCTQHTQHHQHMRIRAHAHSEHIDMHLAIKPNQMHYAYHMNRSNQSK